MLFKCSKKELKFETENVYEIVSNCCLIDRGPFPGKIWVSIPSKMQKETGPLV